MKYIQVYALFLMLVFCTSCGGQNKTNPPQDNIKSSREEPYTESELKEADTLKVPTGQVRNIKQARNGDILISSFLGVFRYDGTYFTCYIGKRFAIVSKHAFVGSNQNVSVSGLLYIPNHTHRYLGGVRLFKLRLGV